MGHGVSLATPPDGHGGRRRPRRVWRGVVGAGAVVAVAVIVATFVQIPYYALAPGSAIDVARMISLPRAQRHATAGAIYMTDVDLIPLRAIDYLFYRFDSDVAILPDAAVTGTSTTAQYDAQGAIDMANARQAATVVALSTLGYPVRALPAGVILYSLLPGSPAASHLSVGDVVQAVDGHPTASLTALSGALAPLSPGARVTLRLSGFPGTGVPGAPRATRLRLGETRVVAGEPTCLPAGTRRGSAPPAGTIRACLGAIVEPRYRTVGLPFPVAIDSEGIIGPSAGLAFTLGLLDELDRSELSAGRRVAATGTMAVDGSVGQVGGVAQKAVAAREAGASLFLVPTGEYEAAKAHAGSMRVVAVSSLTQAVAALERLGGKLPARGPTP